MADGKTQWQPLDQEVLDELVGFWREKNGKSPTGFQTQDLISLADLYVLWQESPQLRVAPLEIIRKILRPARSGAYFANIPLPKQIDPPLSVVQFWHALLVGAERENFVLAKPQHWEKISRTEDSRDALQRLYQEEERDTIQHWLEEFAREPEVPDLPAEIHVRIGKGQVFVYVQMPGDSKPTRITANQWTQLDGSGSITPFGQSIMDALGNFIANRGEIELHDSYFNARDALRRLMSIAKKYIRGNGVQLSWMRASSKAHKKNTMTLSLKKRHSSRNWAARPGG